MSLLLHITDAHLYADPSQMLKGICPNDSFAAVLTQAHQQFPAPDGIILGGDLAQDVSAVAYLRVAEMLKRWSAPFMITPGNHADILTLKNVLVPALTQSSTYSNCLQLDGWQVITLNSHNSGKVPGFLAESELERLDELLEAVQDKHTLVAVHHHPVSINCRWLDQIGLKNRDRLWSVIDRHEHVSVVLCGHIHQKFDAMRNNIRVLGTPSTCVQFEPKRDNFILDSISPGYRWLELSPDGGFNTGVERIDGFIPQELENTVPY